ncbi:MAG: hypothetical protein KDK08_13520 [Rhizobiaceae bacterium]|nr:hypothetical protein [Rhizobiaceae bacterium]
MSAPFAIQITWEGISIEITYHERYSRDPAFDHIELRVEENRIIPVTETGYRSHFLPSEVVHQYGGPEGYVRAWLDHEAQSPDWKKREEASRQMSLF